ncbi:agmatine deiminase [Vibrio sp. 10N.286.49.C2]|uniref:agmatine deiminase n=1 Tax=unclassified Vibrio TaxID=2614977 RepID=UPI000C828FE6|nr:MULTISPECIES: agmatine deiminase [unclassified Vibrio]PMH26465.1 agmatine deiminase [Vibrio sp. 10N.286.49.C2]PMH54811.1 agmatine deiminase [Vibrio sp. 10N.286.49.B1]PMH81002.1 agmatine deiminase [Vibrio sp. 10N.286.48.B7]
MRLTTTPKQDGFSFPAEFEPVREVWLAWPERKDNWRNDAKPAQQTFANVANAIADVVQVTVAVTSTQYERARTQLHSSIKLVEMAYNDSWMRDIGPTVVVNARGERRGISWKFNAWGGEYNGLYDDWSADDQVAESVCEVAGMDYYQAPIVLEGGSIHTDGEGTLYTTEECLLSPGRNPELQQTDIEKTLCEYLGVEKIVWLPKGLYNDETDGHVDNLIHVIGPAKVILSWTDDPFDPQFKLSREAYTALRSQKDAKGRDIEVIKIPVPGPLYYTQEEAEGIDSSDGMVRQEGERLSASYANFLMVNEHVFLPFLDEQFDSIAIEILKKALPNFHIVGIPTREVLLGGGNIHCITQQIPA